MNLEMYMYGSNIRVRRCAPNIHKASSIIVIPNALDNVEVGAWLPYDSFECEVLDVGPGELMPNGVREVMGVMPGDIVVIPQGHGDGTTLDDGTFCVDISAVEAVVHREE